MPIDPTGPEHRAEPVEAPELLPSFGAGLIRPACHWLPRKMGAATRSAAPGAASDDHDMDQAETGSDAERIAAIETLVALAAKIEAARADAESVGASITKAPAAATMPQFICDSLEEAFTSAGRRAPEKLSELEEQAPVESPVPSSVDHASRWTDALRASYPEAGLLLVAVALLGAWIYASVPRKGETPPSLAIAQIHADEASPPAPADARLKFMGGDSCSGRPCESLLVAFTPDAAAAAGGEPASGVSYTAAAQPDTAQDSTQASAPAAPDEPRAPPAQEDAPPTVVAAAGDAASETEPIRTEPITSEPIETEPVSDETILAAQEPSPAKLESPADVSVTLPSAVEIQPGDVSEAPAASASIELDAAAPAESLDVEAERAVEASPGKTPAANTTAIPPRHARPAKAGPAIRKAQQPQAAKKNAVATQSKPGGAKAALAKSAPKSPAGEKQAGTASASANKAPGFPAAAPTVLFKPSPPAAVASKAPEPPIPASSATPGDKPPGFEIQTNLGGGFFAFQPY